MPVGRASESLDAITSPRAPRRGSASARAGRASSLRSQAKRLLARFDRFKEVVLDFAGLHTIGQALADEVFRVFANLHPDIRVTYVNAVPDVEKMIRRALSASTPPDTA